MTTTLLAKCWMSGRKRLQKSMSQSSMGRRGGRGGRKQKSRGNLVFSFSTLIIFYSYAGAKTNIRSSWFAFDTVYAYAYALDAVCEWRSGRGGMDIGRCREGN